MSLCDVADSDLRGRTLQQSLFSLFFPTSQIDTDLVIVVMFVRLCGDSIISFHSIALSFTEFPSSSANVLNAFVTTLAQGFLQFGAGGQ